MIACVDFDWKATLRDLAIVIAWSKFRIPLVLMPVVVKPLQEVSSQLPPNFSSQVGSHPGVAKEFHQVESEWNPKEIVVGVANLTNSVNL